MAIVSLALKRNSGRAVRGVLPHNIVRDQRSRRSISRFSEDVGMVYFGNISSRDEDYRLVRGFMTSPSMLDKHYAVGSVKGYDVSFLVRSDTIILPDKKVKRVYMSVLMIDLRVSREIPNFYITIERDKYIYESKFRRSRPIALGRLGAYPSQFTTKYVLYGMLDRAIEIEGVFNQNVAEFIARETRYDSFEVEDNVLYLYVREEYPSYSLLERMMNDGIRLAEMIDESASPANYLNETEIAS